MGLLDLCPQDERTGGEVIDKTGIHMTAVVTVKVFGTYPHGRISMNIVGRTS